MKIKKLAEQALYLFHRIFLRFGPYRQLVIRRGWDSRRYKTYYQGLHFEETENVDYGEIDGYKDESDYEKIVQLVDNLARMVPEPAMVLDIGCGTGRYLKQMKQTWPGAYFVGIDISREIVEKFTIKQVPGVPIHVLDIETDDTYHIENQGKFDLVCMIGIIQVLSLSKTGRILDKVNRLCKDGGYLYIQFNLETNEKKSSVGYKRYAVEELETLLAHHGFTALESGRTDILRDYAYIVAWKTLE
jgi:SAM-dependent methyltransferase